MSAVALGAELFPAPEPLRRGTAGAVALFVGVWLLRGEALDGSDWWRERVRLRAPGGRDWAVIGGAAVFAGVLAAASAAPLVLTFALAQTLGDEWLWRGVVLPRHEALGRFGWMLNGIAWLATQLSVIGIASLSAGAGLGLAPASPLLSIAALLPLAVILPLAARLTRSTYVPLAIRSALVVAVLS